MVAENDLGQEKFPLLWYYHIAQLSIFSLYGATPVIFCILMRLYRKVTMEY